MGLILDLPVTVNDTISAFKINSFAVDLERLEITVGYYKQDSLGKTIGEDVLTIDGPDFTAAITDASTIAGADVYAALRKALYNQIVVSTGSAGIIS